MTNSYLPDGLSQPVASLDGLDAPFWQGAEQGILRIQRCGACNTWQWGPEWLCHKCHSFDMHFHDVEPTGKIYSYQRVWHPVHSALNSHGPYIIVLVELPQAGNVRMVGNLVGDPQQEVHIGGKVEAVFEHHPDADPAFTLIQWRAAS